ncbi:MAG TPA: GlxA family transcriptional regulator [Ramlibacter sp.]|nr:GlxA family transcriptional regulator [Ramlibacter sp.]
MAQRIAFVVFPGFQILDMAALTVFELANLVAGRAAYKLEVVSARGGAVSSSIGAEVITAAPGRMAPDTLLVAGAMEPAESAPELLDWLASRSALSRRTASICTGAFVLAEAGLLEGLRATTHWAYARELQRKFPGVRVEEDRIFVRDGSVWTSAGMTACLDLALALVEADLGPAVAQLVSRKLVLPHRRPGGQSQFSAMSELQPASDRIQDALAYAKANLRQELTVERLADVVHWSPRHFSRAFRQETGLSPAKAVEKLRLEAARALIAEGNTPVARVAQHTGFADEERMRRAFLRAFGHPPQALKRQARSAT